MSPREASLIHKNLKTVLQVQLKRATREETGHSQEALVDVCRNDPKMLNALAPFLSDAQVKSLMNEAMDELDEPV